MKIILYCVLYSLCVPILVWYLVYKIKRPLRKMYLEHYWNVLKSDAVCTNVWEFYLDGVHIHKKYRIPFSSVGCQNLATFHAMALKSVNRSMERLYQNGGELTPEDAEIAIKLRADIAKLLMVTQSPAERQKAANTFVTT